MNKFLRSTIFPGESVTTAQGNWTLLALRLMIGILMLVHGIEKVMNFDALSATFPDPIGLGSGLSLSLAIFAEVLCSLGVLAGLLFRLALIPLIFTMCVAAFGVMSGAPWGARELPVMYLLIYLLLFFTGPGQYSLDALIGRRTE